MRRIYICILLFIACSGQKKEDGVSFKSNNVIDVQSKLVSIDNGLVFGNSRLFGLGRFFLIKDLQASDKGISLIDRETFQEVAVTGTRGQGPSEISNYGQLLLVGNSKENYFYALDYARLKLLRFSVDSVLKVKDYLPKEILSLNGVEMPGRMCLYNDTEFIGRGLKIIGNSTFGERMSIFNIKTGKMESFGYEHPMLRTNKDTRAFVALSSKLGVYVNCYANQDLMTICNLKGELIRNIYGSQWENNDRYRLRFYKGVDFYKDKIIASYIGGKSVFVDEYKRRKGTLPTKFLIFDAKGKYLKTLDVKHEILSFCIDRDRGCLLMYLNDLENPLAYINLSEFI